MSAVAAAIGLGAVGTIASGIMGANAASDAADAQRQSTRDTNQLNYDMFRQSRGSDGSAVLPLYLQSQDGGLFERQLGSDLVGAYDMTAPDRAAFESVWNSYKPMVSGARRTAAGIFNGDVGNEMMANFQPVKKARVAMTRQAAMDALSKTLDEIGQMQAGRGFSGDSLGNRMVRFKANESAANAMAGANLSNLEQEKAIRDAALNLRLSNLDLPFSMAGKEMDFSNSANNAYLDAIQRRMVPFNFLRIGQGPAFQYQPLNYSATPSAGQVALQGFGQLGGTAANYFAGQQQQKSWQDFLNGMQTNNYYQSIGLPSVSQFSAWHPAAAVPATTGFDFTPPPPMPVSTGGLMMT